MNAFLGITKKITMQITYTITNKIGSVIIWMVSKYKDKKTITQCYFILLCVVNKFYFNKKSVSEFKKISQLFK